MSSLWTTSSNPEVLDVILIGAGISGINSAYRLKTYFPHVRYAILESRDEIGGTWNQYTYPGVRSDSSMHTLGFAWNPFPYPQPIGTGAQILKYLKDTASEHHIAEHILFGHKVISSDWSSQNQEWTVTASHEGKQKHLTARWIILGTGFYDAEAPAQANIPGIDSFKGDVLRPQFWPKDYEYENKRIALIGSGATAVSMLPTLAEKAAQVTMIQRSPTYIIAEDNSAWLQDYLPLFIVLAFRRLYYILVPYFFVLYCQYFPDAARETLRGYTVKLLPKGVDQDPHFKPRYNPWEQRMCLDTDGAFYKTLHRPNVRLVTATIDTVTETGIQIHHTHTGTKETIEFDSIVKATGLNMKLGGHIELQVDGKPMSWAQRHVWNGTMLEGIPNMTFIMGYTNASWTLGADNTAFSMVRLLKYMDQHGLRSAVPQRTKEDIAAGSDIMWRNSATYSLVAQESLPVYGKTGLWKARLDPLAGYFGSRWGDYKSGLQFSA
ncbi:FAD/NAD(P)-binding domain-containing protein [Hypomontagnella submonticulosa]|nr:FAD/NAD(P)-binding domain-containing protein [Hypomontagnella submonticulosa]